VLTWVLDPLGQLIGLKLIDHWRHERGASMTNLILVSETQIARISPFFPLSHGMPRFDDRRMISGIICVIRNGLLWHNVLSSYWPHKTIYNRFVRWRD
jgi:putative transposase